jgi:integrase
MERYFGHIADRFLDELNYRFWSRFVADLKAGTLQVGFTEQNGERVPILLGPLASATLLGVLNAASTLYDIAHLYEGLQGMARGDNPPKQAKELVSTPRQKKKLIEMDHLGKAWAASGTLVAPYWRDLFRVCVLTGLRRSLVWSMRFDEIDFAKGVYLIDPLKEGTKQRGRDFGEDPEMMRIPLSAPVMNILRERRLFAPDKDGPVWYAPGKNQGRRKMGETLGDQRSSWAIISEYATGYHFGPQDVRRTFATVGSLAVRDDLFSVALLMMHSTSTLARTANLPEITVRYINTPSAQAQMRAAAEKIAAYVQDLANKAVAGVQVNIETPELPPELEAAVGSE